MITKNIKLDRDKVTFWLVIGYLILRIGVIQGADIYYKMHPTMPVWVVLSFEFCIYCVTAILLYIEKDRLTESNIDRLSIILFVIFGAILRTPISSQYYDTYFQIAFFVVGFLVFVKYKGLTSNLTKVVTKDLTWVFIGISLGVGIAVIRSGFDLFFYYGYRVLFSADLLTGITYGIYYITSIISNFCHSSITEEPVFRGFLWGVLRRKNWSDKNIFIFQAILFVMGHLRSIERWNLIYGMLFIVFVPLVSFTLGRLAWRSKSIAPGMFAHACYNAGRGVFTLFLDYLHKL